VGNLAVRSTKISKPTARSKRATAKWKIGERAVLYLSSFYSLIHLAVSH